MKHTTILVVLTIILASPGLAQDADNAEAHFKRAETFLQSKQYKDAVKELQSAIRLKSQWPEAHLRLGQAYYLISPPADPEFKFGYGHERDPDEKSKAALEAFEEAVRLRPDWPEALNYLGEYYSAFQQDEKAFHALKEALRLKPEFVQAQENLGIAYLYAGLYSDGIEQLYKAINMNPTLPRPHKLLGLTYLILGDTVNALVQYKLLQTLDPAMANDLEKWIQSPNKPYIGVHNILNGKLLPGVRLAYPADAKRKGIEGQVAVEVIVDESGKVVSARAVSGPVELRGTAEDAALTARFKPTKVSGVAVSVKGIVLFAWRYVG